MPGVGQGLSPAHPRRGPQGARFAPAFAGPWRDAPWRPRRWRAHGRAMSNTSHNDPFRSESRFASPEAQHDLFAEHAAKLRRVVGGQVETSDANLDDACGFAWTQLVDAPPSRRGSIFAWLATVAIREAWRLHRSEHRDAHDGKVILDAIESPTASAVPADRIAVDQMIEALRTIHPRKRRMLLLHAAGFSCREIAAEYGVSVERARQLVYQARLQVRERSEAD